MNFDKFVLMYLSRFYLNKGDKVLLLITIFRKVLKVQASFLAIDLVLILLFKARSMVKIVLK